MSYRGKPSKGCRLCRARKRKVNHANLTDFRSDRWLTLLFQCDLQKPTCSLCKKLGEECEYRDNFELVHRDQTIITEKRAQEKWRRRLTTQQDSSIPSVSVEHYKTAGLQLQATQPWSSGMHGLSIQPCSSFQDLALPRFLFDFVNSPGIPSRKTTLALLPRMYTDSAPDSFLGATVNAVALANFAGRFKHAEARKTAVRYYITALQQFAIAAKDPETMQSEQALFSIFLLGLYEVSWNSSRLYNGFGLRGL
jgi:hypothetical protein